MNSACVYTKRFLGLLVFVYCTSQTACVFTNTTREKTSLDLLESRLSPDYITALGLAVAVSLSHLTFGKMASSPELTRYQPVL
jgi:hypothetical protein